MSRDAKKIKIVFMGTPVLASYCLSELAKNGFNVVAVVTAPDKPAGRGLLEKGSAVKQAAVELGIPVFQPANLDDNDFVDNIRTINPDLQVVVAFRKIPKVIWEVPSLGTINMHASLLPNYRGAAPINWAIINGEEETGVTTFFIDEKIDTGKVILQHKICIGTNETAGELHDKIMVEGSRLVINTINAIASGQNKAVEQLKLIQQGLELKKAPKIYKDQCLIDWNKPGKKVTSFIHGLSPTPGAFTRVIVNRKEMTLKIYNVGFQEMTHTMQPGTLNVNSEKKPCFATPDGFVILSEIQLEGKKKMTAEELFRGFSLHNFPG